MKEKRAEERERESSAARERRKGVAEKPMATPKQMWEQQQSQMQRVKNSGIISYNGSPVNDDKEEEMSRSAVALFRAKEEEIERKKSEVKDKVQAQLGRVEETTKRLAEIQEVSEELKLPNYMLEFKWFIFQITSFYLFHLGCSRV